MYKKTLQVPFTYTQRYLPTKRHRKPRTFTAQGFTWIGIPDLEKEEFPVAMVVSDLETRKDGSFGIVRTTLRAYGGNLYRWENGLRAPSLAGKLSRRADNGRHAENPGDLSDSSVLTENDSEECIARLNSEAAEYVMYHGYAWHRCGEPMYVVMTFGLGHNHGGTALMLDYEYNPNIPKERYFTALERKEAVAYALKTAAGRGDDRSLNGIRHCRRNITVHMPEMVRRDPDADHDGGDPFMETAERLISGSANAAEAGLGVIAFGLLNI